MKNICMAALLCWATACPAATPIERLADRIDAGASRKFIFEKVESPHDFFELDQRGHRVVIRGNDNVSLATGLNWYLRHYARIHLSWNAMHAQLPDTLPPVERPERHETPLDLRYALNYCTFSYTMPFWDWARWEQRAVPLQVLQSEQRLCLAWERQSAVLLVVLYSALQGPTAVMHLADGLLILRQRSDVNVMETG